MKKTILSLRGAKRRSNPRAEIASTMPGVMSRNDVKSLSYLFPPPKWGRVGWGCAIFFLLLTSQMAFSAELPTLPTQTASPTAGTLQGFEKTIFLDLRDINVVDVIKFLALEGNLNIVTSKNVQGRSTLLLKNVTIHDALDIIVISNQLAYHIMNGIIYVMTETEYLQIYGKSYNDKKKVATRTLKYAKPSYALAALQNIQSGIGKVIIDEETGTIVMIDTDEKLAQMNKLVDDIENKLNTEVVKLNYALAKDVETQLKSKLDAKAVGNIMSDARSNQLIVTGYPDRLKEVLPMIKALDEKTRAVLIDVRILQLTINPKFDYGIDWEKAFTGSKNRFVRSLDFRDAFPISSSISSDSSIGSVGKIAVGDLTANEMTIALKAIKQIQKTNVLANPRLMILDRQEARINIGDKIPYVVTTTTGTGANASVSEEVKFIDVGIALVVTPVITDNNYITMKIRPEISSRTGTLTTPAKAEIPLVNTTFIESSVVVKDGKTIILGGLRRDDLSQSDKGVPYLMDIPYVGHLFKSRADSSIKTEIVIFISPKIVTGDEDNVPSPIPLKPSKEEKAEVKQK